MASEISPDRVSRGKRIDVNLSAGVERFNGLIDHVRSLESTLVGRDLTELYLSALNG